MPCRNYEMTTRDILSQSSENSELTSCNYEFFEGMNLFYKSESRHFVNSDMVWTLTLRITYVHL